MLPLSLSNPSQYLSIDPESRADPASLDAPREMSIMSGLVLSGTSTMISPGFLPFLQHTRPISVLLNTKAGSETSSAVRVRMLSIILDMQTEVMASMKLNRIVMSTAAHNWRRKLTQSIWPGDWSTEGRLVFYESKNEVWAYLRDINERCANCRKSYRDWRTNKSVGIPPQLHWKSGRTEDNQIQRPASNKLFVISKDHRARERGVFTYSRTSRWTTGAVSAATLRVLSPR